MLRRLALAGLVAVVSVSTAAAATPKKFTPAVLAGTWAGTWTNQTFNTTGTLTLKISSAHNALIFAATITGNTFGCARAHPTEVHAAGGEGRESLDGEGLQPL